MRGVSKYHFNNLFISSQSAFSNHRFDNLNCYNFIKSLSSTFYVKKRSGIKNKSVRNCPLFSYPLIYSKKMRSKIFKKTSSTIYHVSSIFVRKESFKYLKNFINYKKPLLQEINLISLQIGLNGYWKEDISDLTLWEVMKLKVKKFMKIFFSFQFSLSTFQREEQITSAKAFFYICFLNQMKYIKIS